MLWIRFTAIMLFLGSAVSGQPEVEVIHYMKLDSFPSSSAVEQYKDFIYVVGDDARQVLVLDRAYRRVDSIMLFQEGSRRIPKNDKTDFEAAVLLPDTAPRLMLWASGSGVKRKKLVEVLLSPGLSKPVTRTIDTSPFIDSISQNFRVNIEGAALIGDQFLLGNRSPGENFFILAKVKGNPYDSVQAVKLIRLQLPDSLADAGISGLDYDEKQKRLFITLSSEQTPTAWDDGPIGKSYVAWISDFERFLTSESVYPDQCIDLSRASGEFAWQKIEGVCVESSQRHRTVLHLVSDNDDGRSHVFKVSLSTKRR